MAAQKGSALLMKIGDGASPEAFTTIGGLRSTSITLNEETVDVTTKDSSGKYRELLAQGGIVTVSVSGSGVFTDAASETSLKTAFNTASFKNFQFLVPSFGTFTGAFQVSSLEYAGEYNGEVTYSATFDSAGSITFTSV